MLERLKKLKSIVQYYVANFKNDQDSNITPEEWQLVNDIILLLEQKSVLKTMHCSQAWSRTQNHWQSLLTFMKNMKKYQMFVKL